MAESRNVSAEKRSISGPAELFRKADERKEQLGYSAFSDYIQALIRADVIERGALIVHETPVSYKAKPKTKP